MPSATEIKAKLIIKHSGGKERELSINQESAVIGRWDPESGAFPEIDLTEDDPESYVSRKHARIFIKDNKYFIEDLGSANGTYFKKGIKLSQGSTHELHNGDEIIVGRIFLSFLIE